MKKLFDLADQYLKESDWKTIAALKFCLLSLGIIIGMLLPESVERGVMIGCICIFAVTYTPLMGKLFAIARRK